MPPTREFFIGQVHYGSAPAPKEVVHNEIHDAIGQCFFCPICSDIWARCVIVGQASAVRHRACERHQAGQAYTVSSLGVVSSGEIPGSLYLTESRQWNDSLPDRVISRELMITLKWAAASPVIEKSIASNAEAIYNYLHTQRRVK